MKTLIGLFVLIATINFAHSAEMSNSEANTIANAIYRVEGGEHAKVPYGILSVKTDNPRQVCINTVKNNFVRWQKSDQKIDYVSFLGSRYAPVGAVNDPRNLNSNWVKNLRAILRQDKSNDFLLGKLGIN